MQILSGDQIRAWDQFTIANEPIASIELMERAASKCFEWIGRRPWKEKKFFLLCGKGNNGGDGLAICRMLLMSGYEASVYILENGKLGSADFQQELQRLHHHASGIHFIQEAEHFPAIEPGSVVIDALFGSGLNQPPQGLTADLIRHINQSRTTVVSIDLPSGLYTDQTSQGNEIVRAHHTLSFQCYKPALLLQENAPWIGEVVILPIGLHPGFLSTITPWAKLLDVALARSLYQPRSRFAHKGHFGHALLIAGSYGKMGAATLAVKACIRSGAGLTTALVPSAGYPIMQVAVPEAMTLVDTEKEHLSSLPGDMERYRTIGIGPGIGTEAATLNLLSFVIRRYQHPVVIDADGLNGLSMHPELIGQLPKGSILTPHPKEFDRLFGDHQSDFERVSTALARAKEGNIIIVLKGHHTLIATPGGQGYFNSTGNAGLAKGGSGDVLTGIITALLAQGYDPVHAALLGVYLHGGSADKAAEEIALESMTASDLIDHLSGAFRQLSKGA